MKRLWTICLWGQLLSGVSEAQAAVVFGKVTDATTGEVLIGANVYDEQSRRGTMTDEYGRYRLSVSDGGHQLRVSYVGYETLHPNLVAGRDTLLNFKLLAQEQLHEVVVEDNDLSAHVGQRHLGVVNIPLSQLNATPALFGEVDLLKTIQRQPGVQHGLTATSGLLVRGGESDQNLYLLDGSPLYDVSHAMGFVSSFQQEAIKKVDFYKNSFPACYGGRVSSVVDIRTKDGDMERYHGSLSLGLLTSHLHLEGPLSRRRTSFILTARRSYLDLLARPFLDPGTKSSYAMYDVNAKVSHAFSDKVRLIASFYKGQDAVRYGNEYKDTYHSSEYGLDRTWGNLMGSLRLVSICSPKLFNNTYITYSTYQSETGSTSKSSINGNGGEDKSESRNVARSVISDLSLSSDFDWQLTEAQRIQFGGRVASHLFQPRRQELQHSHAAQGENRTSHDTHRNPHFRYTEGVLYAEHLLNLDSRWVANTGVHATVTHLSDKTYFSLQPRLSLAAQVGEGTWLKASYAQMQQMVHRLSATDIVLPQDYWVPATRQIRPLTSTQYSLGISQNSLGHWNLEAEAYYKKLHHLLEYKDGHLANGYGEQWEEDVAQGRGDCYGLELSARYNSAAFDFSVNYTWAKSTRIYTDGSVNAGERFCAHFDRRHTINVYALKPLGRRVELFAEWQYFTGAMVTIPTGYAQTLSPATDSYIFDDDYRWSADNLEPEHQNLVLRYTRHNNYRLPASHQMNIGANFHRRLKHVDRTIAVSVMNVYNRRNPDLITVERLDEEGVARLRLKKVTLLPCLPSINYQIRF